MTFESLKTKPEIVKALGEIGITKPTAIQEKSFKLITEGKDIVGISKTGSGKTAAFGIPLLNNLNPIGLQVLILAPTRELVVQIATELEKFGKYTKPTVAKVFGGVGIEPQIQRIKKSKIVVGTPGRLLDHLSRGTLNLSMINTVVLDEADKMVDMGFIDDIRKILNYTPKKRQILLFGATISTEIDRIKREYMNQPQEVKGEAHVKSDLLKQFFYNVQPHQKFSYLVHLLKKENADRIIIFCSTRATVETLTRNLKKQKLEVDMIHGKLTQNRRLKVIEHFNKGHPKILVASTVAARGLHIENVSHVYNYDLSQDPEEYIHRIGRTARAGTSGDAITLLSDRDHDVFREILHRYKVDVKELPMEEYEKLRFEARQSGRRSYGGRPQSRGSSGRNPFSGPRSGHGQRSSYGGRGSSRGRHPSRGRSSSPRSFGRSRGGGSGGGFRSRTGG